MKSIKNRLLEPNYEVEPAEDKELRVYLRKISYWVGCFAIEFNNLEYAIDRLLELHINGGDIRGYEYIFVSSLSFTQKNELLERLYRYQQNFVIPESTAASLVESTLKMISEIKEIGKLRNIIVHTNYYSLDKNGNVRVKTKFTESDAEEQWAPITRDFIVEIINRVAELTEKLEEIEEIPF